ncbi:hypothetical protein ACVXHB_09150 [Escherichia coli]
MLVKRMQARAQAYPVTLAGTVLANVSPLRFTRHYRRDSGWLAG